MKTYANQMTQNPQTNMSPFQRSDGDRHHDRTYKPCPLPTPHQALVSAKTSANSVSQTFWQEAFPSPFFLNPSFSWGGRAEGTERADVDVPQRKLYPHPFKVKPFVAYSRLLTVNTAHIQSSILEHFWTSQMATGMPFFPKETYYLYKLINYWLNKRGWIQEKRVVTHLKFKEKITPAHSCKSLMHPAFEKLSHLLG